METFNNAYIYRLDIKMIPSILMVRIFVASFLIIGALFLSPSFAFAQANNASTSAFVTEVDRVANLRDRILERIILFFKFNPESSIEYQSQLVEKRLAEVKYVVDSGDWDPIEDVSSRYSSYLGRLTKFVLDHKMVSKKDDLIKMYSNHEAILEEILKNFESNSGFWLLIQHDINANKLYQQQIRDLN